MKKMLRLGSFRILCFLGGKTGNNGEKVEFRIFNAKGARVAKDRKRDSCNRGFFLVRRGLTAITND